jgi:hypothetical protein
MSHNIQFEGAELASVSIRTAKNGNTYASGILILRDIDGKFQASLPFRSFDAADQLASLSRTETNTDLTGGDLHFDGEDADSRERVAAKQQARPRANVSGWLRTTKGSDGKWSTIYMLSSLSI